MNAGQAELSLSWVWDGSGITRPAGEVLTVDVERHDGFCSMQSRVQSYNEKIGYFSQFHHLLKKKWDWVNFSCGQRFPRIIKLFPQHGWLLCDLHCDVTVLLLVLPSSVWYSVVNLYFALRAALRFISECNVAKIDFSTIMLCIIVIIEY